MKQIFFLVGWLLSLSLSAQVQLGADINGEAVGDLSGRAVALSADGNTLAIGAIGNDGNGNVSGQVRVYRWSGSSWSQLGSDIDGEAAVDQLGWSVDLSADGQILAIGAPGNDNSNGSNSGQVRVYHWSGSSWSQVGADIDGEAASDQSGWSVALSADGNTLAIGAPLQYGINGGDSGQVRVYHWSGSSWSQVGADIDGEAAVDELGYSVALSADGNTLAIGIPLDDNSNGSNSGQVRVYHWSGSTWTQVGADINGEAAGDFSGYSVALSADGNTLAIGAFNNDGVNGSDSGHVRVYHWSGSSWSQVGADIDGEAADDASGYFVALSADGQTVAIAAPGNTGINGNASGQVRTYHWNGSNWSQVGTDINGAAAEDYLGWSVALSADGQTVASGAPGSPITGAGSGYVRVYRYCNALQAQVLSLQASESLGGSTCQVRLLGQATGNSFVFTGPGGYVFSNVYRQEGPHPVFADGVRQPGVYQLRMLSQDVCESTATVTVSGMACP